LIGSEVLAINGVDVSIISKSIEPYISRDNDYFLHFAVPIALTCPDLLKAVGVKIQGEFVEFKVRKGASVTTQRLQTLPAIDPEKLAMKLIAPRVSTAPSPDYLSHLDKNFWLKSLDDATLYVQINQCLDEEKETLDQFADTLDHAVKTGKPHNVILDVRLNNGGNYSKMFGVLKVLFSFEREPNARLFVIAGRNTLSAAQNFINAIDQFGAAVFVGEPSGSRPDHVGDDTTVVLPYSGIIGSIACALHQTDFRDQREWIAPQLPITLSSGAYFSQRDPVVETIMKFVASN